MAEQRADVLVIGSGPGGYTAAFRAADLGMGVALVEADEKPGGVCLHRGCIPSKALLHAAKLIAEAREAKAWGLSFQKPGIDLDALRGWKDGIVSRHVGGLVDLCRRRGVTLIRGRAVFEDSGSVRVEGPEGGSRVTFGHAILATGSHPATFPGLDLQSPRVMDSTSALKLEAVPKSLLVVGGGYIGLELGTVYAELGSRVTVVELTDGLLPGADRDLVRPLSARVEKVFEAVRLNTKVGGMREVDGGVAVRLEAEGKQVEETFERVLVSVGRRPNSAGIGLERTKAEMDRKGFVGVDAQQRTRDERILAIGDVAGEPMLAHKAMHEGKVAAEVLAGEPAAFDGVVPAVVFTDPEIAWCGLTETEARRKGIEVKVARFPWAASGRASTLGRNEGVTKLVIDPKTERVLGVGVVGAGAGELIAEGVLAVEMGAVARDLALSIHPHPTLSETIGGAAEVFLGTATDLYLKRK
ncbi:MAG: dihydrolipoyl dehydrogenase [Candidatus Latescibacteria bacterium]|nr:dihydrolipoyl dehydrogenase [Candidatus Latescibacterota bacterium]